MDPAVIAALVAGVVALITGTLTAAMTLAAARHRGRIDQELQNRLKIAEARLPAYAALWKCMAPLSPTASDPLFGNTRSDLDRALRKAFYEDGGGLLLSHKALSRYIEAVETLNKDKVSDADIRASFSALRTQMKTDLAVYTEDEAIRSVRGDADSATPPPPSATAACARADPDSASAAGSISA